MIFLASSAHAGAPVQIALSADDSPAKSIEGSVREQLEGVAVDLTITRAEVIDPREVVLPPATFEKLVRVWIDVHGTAACAKITLIHGPVTFTDYFVLLKTEEGWKIANKAFHGQPT